MNFPRYPRKAHASGNARIRIQNRDYYLGAFGSPESHTEYRRLMAEFASGKHVQTPREKHAARTTINSMIGLWLDDAGRKNVAARELVQIKLASAPLIRLFGSTHVDDFTAAQLELLRDAMISGSWLNDEERAVRKKMSKPIGWSRSYTTHQVARVKRLFRWAESHGHAQRGTWEHLRSLGPIPRNARVRTARKRQPADFETQVKPCLPFMPPQVAAMVQVQYYAGMRPGEVIAMRRNEVDTTSVEGVWLYRPAHHKTESHGELVKAIGPLGQIALAPWLMAAEPDGIVFPPLRNRYQRGQYTVEGYGRAIARACERAKVPVWSAYCLRHAACRRAEEAGGLTSASAMLGHRGIETTLIYAGRQNIAIAVETAKKIG